MIRLKDIMHELWTPDGDASQAEHLLVNIANGLSMPVLRKWAQLSDTRVEDMQTTAYRDPSNAEFFRFTPKFVTELTKHSIWNSGNLHIIFIPGKYSQYYFLIDISEDRALTGFIGIIEVRESRGDVGEIDAKKRFNLRGKEIHWSNIISLYKGRGFGRILYDVVLQHAGVLFSDSSLFEGSFNMWVHHLSKSSFFGAIVTTPTWGSNVLLPIDPRATSKETLSAKVNNFVAVQDRSLLSKTVRRFEYNTRGLDIFKEVGIVVVADTFKLDNIGPIKTFLQVKYPNETFGKITFDSLCDDFDSIPELMDFLEIIRGGNSFAVRMDGSVYQNASKLKLLIVLLNDTTVLIRSNKTGGINVQIMD